MKSRARKIVMLLLAAALLFVSGRVEKSLNGDRDALGITISLPLQDAPPVLALMTQALGGFRGLISNFLWMRANDLQINDQFFEAAQLADWITDLEPHYSQVWVYQGWNEAYNISVKFKDFGDRWRWVQNGIELLRDRGLRYNPDDLLIYRELGWFYQHKMGADLDDANTYYKTEWAQEMTPFFGPHGTNIDALVNPRTSQDRTNAYILETKYKIDPVFAQKVNDEWGPLDWRLPEAHAIYWGTLGLEKSKKHPDKVDPSLVIQVRRIIYQSMMQAFEHGQIIDNPFANSAELGPNLAIIPKTNEAYERSMQEDPGDARNIEVAHRNFLLNATYYLYEANHIAQAQKWYDKVRQEYPDKTILQNDVNSFPRNVSLDEYCVYRVQGVATDTSRADTTAAIEGLLASSYEYLAIGQDDRYAGLGLLARKVWETYMHKIRGFQNDVGRTGLPPFSDMNKLVLSGLLDPVNGLPYGARAVIRSQLRLPGDATMPYGVISTNSVVTTHPSTNAPAGPAGQ
ncbi:MAG TPA: hypothetical protein VNV43_09780 [Candidatus Acidoferrales bacterium]|jgi:hypothetical protein|nr:hypothetical protein [Candidatus Acidoferrales bacterium]